MTSFVRIKLSGVGSFAKLETCEGDDISDLISRACARFPSWKADSTQLSLYLVAAGGSEEPTEEYMNSILRGDGRLGVGKSLTSVGIVSGAWLMAAVAPAASATSIPALSKTLILVVNGEDEYGEVVPTSVDITITTQGELEKLAKRHGGGSLVLDNTCAATIKVEELVNGGVYTLIGGQQEAVKRHTMWAQQADKVLEEAATEAVRDACEKTLGTGLDMRLDLTVTNVLGEKRQFDGLLRNTNTAIVVEAKHVSQPEHVDLVINKALFLLQCAQEDNAKDLKGISSVVPVLASSRFSRSMIALCKARCVGVVKPNGSGYTYIAAYTTILSSSQASHLVRRTHGCFHTFARERRYAHARATAATPCAF